MTKEELQQLSMLVAEHIYNKALISLNKRVEMFLMQKTKKKTKPIAEEDTFFNYATKKQITSAKTIKALKEHSKQFQGEKWNFYATQGQYYKMKRNVRKNEKGVFMNVATVNGFIKKEIFNFYQTEEIAPDKYQEIIERRKTKTKENRNKNARYHFFMENNFTCNMCKKIFDPKDLQIDHIIPLSLGGRHERKNFQCLCRFCNVKKSNKLE